MEINLHFIKKLNLFTIILFIYFLNIKEKNCLKNINSLVFFIVWFFKVIRMPWVDDANTEQKVFNHTAAHAAGDLQVFT